MKNLFSKHLMIGLAMLITAALAVALKPTQKMADQESKINLETMIPKKFGDWQIDATATYQTPPSADVQANLNKIYDQMLSRTYINSKGHRIMLVITYGSKQTQDLKAHRQEVCYTAQGFKVSGLVHKNISILEHSIPVTHMYAVQGQRAEPVTYWFTMGNQVVLSRMERFVVQVKYAVAGIIPDGFLIRVSNLKSDENQAYADHIGFINELMSAIDKKTVNKLLGTK